MNNAMDTIRQVINALSGFLYTPWVPLLLAVGGFYLTFRTGFIQLRLLKESIKVVTEKPKEKNVLNTIDRIDMTLRTYTGGYIRYEGDGYMGGYNPWPIATLWMAWYYLEAGDEKRALENFAFVVNSASSHGFLGEQVNNDAMKPNWVIGLTWSHAMFLLILDKLLEKGLL